MWNMKPGDLGFPRQESEGATHSCNPCASDPVDEVPEQPQVLMRGKPCEDRRERGRKKLSNGKRPPKVQISRRTEKRPYLTRTWHYEKMLAGES